MNNPPSSETLARQVQRRVTVLVAGMVSSCCLPALSSADELPAADAWARLVDVANPYASIGYAYDSNVFRLDDDIPTPDGRSDQYATTSVGFDSDVRVSQQRYELSGELRHNWYNTYDELDYTGGKATAIWHWSAGDSATGRIGYRYRRSLRDFANQLRPDKIKDLRSENSFLAEADIDLPGTWRLGARGDVADISYSETKSLDLVRTTGGVGLSYVFSAGSVVGLDAEFINGDYDTNPAADFDEYTVGPTVDWRISERSQLEAKIGYTSRDQNDPGRTDHDDITGNVTLRMTDTGRRKLTAMVWREFSNLSDEIAEFAIINGISVEPSWKLSNGLDLRVLASYENRDFPVAGTLADRTDDVYTAGASADWPISRNVKLSVSVDLQRRSSTRALQDYDYGNVWIQFVGSL
jgi:hypothetical protein